MIASRRIFIALFLMALGAAGCTTSSLMHQVNGPALAIEPTATEAVLVFVRPSGAPPTMMVMDGNARFLGDSIDASHFEVRLPPGDHLLVLWSENTSGLAVRVAAGKIYYVQIDAHSGGFAYEGDLKALSPRTATWSDLDAWLKSTPQYVPDTKAGQAYLNDRRGEADKRIAAVKKILAALPPDTPPAILPEDGLAPGEKRPAPAAPPKPAPKKK